MNDIIYQNDKGVILLNKLIILILTILHATLLTGCTRSQQDQPIPEYYHLDILYGDVEDYSGNDGQWLNLYQADSVDPTPVYIWAHGNGHTYQDAHLKYEAFITVLLDAGITVISWESIKEMNEDNYQAIMDDADIMFQWVMDHAEDYNLDLNNIIIGGHSRGTIASWRLAQSGYAGIQGIYYGDPAGNLDDVEEVLHAIHPDSPPIVLSYNRNKESNDGVHDPNEGQKIIDDYASIVPHESYILLENQGYPSQTQLGFYQELVPF